MGPTVCAIFALGSWPPVSHISVISHPCVLGTHVVGVGKLCLTRLGPTQGFTFLEQLFACRLVDCAVDAAAAEE